ncbi:hypothetical protein D0894_01120 [Pseudomonas monteilii]|uniref:Uncharacterized protein n=1 Tax=Pseudomonas monteilii TaxID=76759 RepID=A0A399MHI2_9PSED|nr:hypothetical protein D0894_01120 [Pseudomonas monteilii]
MPRSRTTGNCWSTCEGPLRGQARSHRDITGPESCAVPVGAGLPAKRPAQAVKISQEYAAPALDKSCPGA